MRLMTNYRFPEVLTHVFQNKIILINLEYATPVFLMFSLKMTSCFKCSGIFTDVLIFNFSSLSILDGIQCPVNYYRAMIRYNSWRLPRKISTPTLMVWGVHDTALSVEMATLSGRYYESYTLRFVDNAGHWVPHERPTTVNKHMRKFLSTGIEDLPMKPDEIE